MKIQPIKSMKVMLASMIVVACSFTQVNAQGGFGSTSQPGNSVTVNNASAFLSAIQQGNTTVYVDGTISISGMNDVASNTAIIGVGTNGHITGGGLDLNGVSNIIIRNLEFSNASDDCINVQESTTDVLITQCSFTSSSDGMIDIKRESDFITVSWNYFTNHDHTLLLGHSDDHTEDIGHLRVTYHHNYFDGVEGRNPRVRYSALCHVYNNYYVNNNYGIASTQDAQCLVEGNYFDGVDDPCLVGYASSGPGELVETNNVYVNSGSPETSGSVPSPPYGYTVDNPNDVPSIVSANAGVGGNGGSGGGGGNGGGSGGGGGTNNGTINGTYSIIANHSGKALDTYNWGTSNGTNIVQWNYWGGDAQRYNISQVDGEWHRITPVIASGQALDVNEISTADGANIQTWSYWGGEGQQFRFQSAGTGLWRIIARHSGKCLDVEGFSTADGANVMQWTCNSGSNNQMFELVSHNSASADKQSQGLDAQVEMYPNPVNNVLNLSIPQDINNAAQVSIINHVGQRVMEQNQLSNGLNELDVSSLESGLYFAEIKLNNETIIKKFTKQ